MRKIACLAFILSWQFSQAQDFEFQNDLNGNAFYADSVEVFNQDLDSAFIKISTWATEQVLSETDTLEFSQSHKSTVCLKKLVPMLFADEETYFIFHLDISLNNNLLKYKADRIFHYDFQNKKSCANLGHLAGSCGFENNNDAWNAFRKAADQHMTVMLSEIEEYLEAK